MKKRYKTILLLLMVGYFISAKEYDNKWPFINKDNTVVFDYPDAVKGSVLFHVDNGTQVVVRHRTNTKEVFNGSADFWYYVTILNGKYKNSYCWIHGGYITFLDGFDESYWNKTYFPIEVTDKRVFYRNFLATKIVTSLKIKAPKDNIVKDELSKLTLVSSEESTLWYMKEMGYLVINTYKADYGEVRYYYNSRDNIFSFIDVVINKPLSKIDLSPGMSIDELEELFWIDYSIEGNTIMYKFESEHESYYWEFIFNGSSITSYRISQYYD